MSESNNSSSVLSGRKEKTIESFSVKDIFVISLLFGAVGIICGVVIESTLVSLIASLIVMATYIGITHFKDTDLPITVIGDSYYYQGFVFTLIALMASLFTLGVNEQVNMNSLVASFGAALVTTIVGLVARLYVTSFSIEAQKRRERLENQIEKSLDKFSGQIDTLTQQVVISINKVHGQTESTLSDTLEAYSRINQEVLKEFTDTMSNSVEAIDNGVDSITRRLESIEVSPEIISEPIRKTVEQLLKPITEYEQQYVEVNKAFREISGTLVQQYKDSGNLLSEHISGVEASINKVIEDQSTEFRENLNSISEGIVSSLSDITDLKLETQSEIEERLGRLSKGVESLVSNINETVKPISESTQSLTTIGFELTEMVKSISEKSKELSTSIEQSIDSFSNVKNVNSELMELNETVEKLDQSMVKIIEVNELATSKISNSANATESATEQLAKDITEVYKQLSIQVRALRTS